MLATLRQQNLMRESIQQSRVGVPVGETLFGKSVLIVGFGNIAKELIPRPAVPHRVLMFTTDCSMSRNTALLLHHITLS